MRVRGPRAPVLRPGTPDRQTSSGRADADHRCHTSPGRAGVDHRVLQPDRGRRCATCAGRHDLRAPTWAADTSAAGSSRGPVSPASGEGRHRDRRCCSLPAAGRDRVTISDSAPVCCASRRRPSRAQRGVVRPGAPPLPPCASAQRVKVGRKWPSSSPTGRGRGQVCYSRDPQSSSGLRTHGTSTARQIPRVRRRTACGRPRTSPAPSARHRARGGPPQRRAAASPGHAGR